MISQATIQIEIETLEREATALEVQAKRYQNGRDGGRVQEEAAAKRRFAAQVLRDLHDPARAPRPNWA